MCCVLIDIHVLLFHFFTLSLSPQEYFLTLVPSLFFSFYLVLLVAPGPAAINLLMMQQHTYFICSHAFSLDLSHTFFISFSHTVNRLTLSRTTIASYSLFSLFLSRTRSPHTHDALTFFTCVCVRSFLFISILCVCLCSSFIDYLNVTTKLDISTSSNKLGFFLMCVFPFILNISLLFFKRLKLRIFSEFRSRASFSSSYSSSTSSSPSSDTRLFFVIFIVFFGIKALHYFFAGCYNFNSFLFSLAFSHNYAKHARALSHQFTLF